MDVVVVGSLIMDMIAYCERHPLPKETLIGKRLAMFPGGKGLNQAIAAAKAGAHARLFGTIGDDDFGRQLKSFGDAEGVNTSFVAIMSDISSGVGIITVNAAGENSIVVIPGANSQTYIPAFAINRPVIALAQFETPIAETKKLFRQTIEYGGLTILNPSPWQPIDPDLARLCSYIIINEVEAAALYNMPESKNPLAVRRHLQSLPSIGGNTIITLGENGFVLKDGATIHSKPGYKVEVIDTVGAGDCFAGAFAAKLAQGYKPFDAALYANAAAALSVTKPGAAPSMPTHRDVEHLICSREPVRRPIQARPGKRIL